MHGHYQSILICEHWLQFASAMLEKRQVDRFEFADSRAVDVNFVDKLLLRLEKAT